MLAQIGSMRYSVGDCCNDRVKPLSKLSAASLALNYYYFVQMMQCFSHKLSTAMRVDLMNNLWIFEKDIKLYNFIMSDSHFEKLFGSDWYKTVPLYTIHIELDESGVGLIFKEFNNKCKSGLKKGNDDVNKFMNYVPIALNYSTYLIDGGYFTYALEIIENLRHLIELHTSQESLSKQIKRSLNEIHIVILTSKFNCCNTLYDIKQGREIYSLGFNLLRTIHDENFVKYKEKAAAFLTQCSRYCYIIGNLNQSHEHVVQALQFIENLSDDNPHPRIVIDSLRQVTYTLIELGSPQSAKTSIETALTLCKHIVDKAVGIREYSECYDVRDSLLFQECMIDYGFFLGRTDQLIKSYIVLEDAYQVSLLIKIFLSASLSNVAFFFTF